MKQPFRIPNIMRIMCFMTILFATFNAFADNAVTPGPLRIEAPTLHCLGFEWPITGDNNRNATVDVSFRRTDEPEWHAGLPLLRIGGEKVSDMLNWEAPHMFAGSIFDLEPDTEYECRFIMTDPDGGEKRETLTVRTRPVPKACESGRVFHVYPPDYDGPKREPAYTGLKSAWHGPGGDDWGLAAQPQVEPGDIILIHAGLYKTDRMSYSNPLGLTFHGTYVLTKDGTADKPIVIRGAGDGEAIFDGDGCYRLFDVMAADHIHFEDITIRNTEIGVYAGVKQVGGANGIVVKHCRFEDVGIGVFTEYEGSNNFYIADNTMIGREDNTRLRGWNGRFWKEYGELSDVASFVGVKVYGQGHVICHNYITFFHDGVDVHMYGNPEPDPARTCSSIDIHNNDFFLCCDDFIESDGGVHNIRVLRNRGINVAHHGLSAQPIYGGPAYFIGNIVYHAVQSALKFNNHPAGLVVYHNTFCAEWQAGGQPFANVHVMNNLFLGTDRADRGILGAGTSTSYTTFDYNGWRYNDGAGTQFAWKAPDGPLIDQGNTFMRRTPRNEYETLEGFRAHTGMERNGIVVDYDVFERVSRPIPDKPWMVYQTDDLDFRLRSDGAAIDAGFPLANINDGFTGAAPDLGALEHGNPLPVYGPRY